MYTKISGEKTLLYIRSPMLYKVLKNYGRDDENRVPRVNSDTGRYGERWMELGKARTLDHFLARICGWCPLCAHARRRGEGACFRFVRRVEKDICPFCRAYERVRGRAAGESLGGREAGPCD